MYLVGVINTSTSILQIEVDLILMPQLRGPNWWQNDGDFMWFSRVPLQVCNRTHQPIIPHQSTKNSKSKSLSNFNWEGPWQSDTATDSSALSYSNKKNTKIPEKISSFFFLKKKNVKLKLIIIIFFRPQAAFTRFCKYEQVYQGWRRTSERKLKCQKMGPTFLCPPLF